MLGLVKEKPKVSGVCRSNIIFCKEEETTQRVAQICGCSQGGSVSSAARQEMSKLSVCMSPQESSLCSHFTDRQGDARTGTHHLL